MSTSDSRMDDLEQPAVDLSPEQAEEVRGGSTLLSQAARDAVYQSDSQMHQSLTSSNIKKIQTVSSSMDPKL